MASEAQAENLPFGIKPRILEAFKDLMYGETILNFIH